MSDVKLNLLWEINSDGDIEFSVSPEGSDTVLGSIVLDETEIALELSSDLEDYDREGDEFYLREWESLVASLRRWADDIEGLIEDAREIRERQMELNLEC